MRCLTVATVLAISAPALATPEIHVRLTGVSDPTERANHVALVKRSLRDLDVRSIDVVVSKLVVRTNGDVNAKVDVVLSDAGGMRSIASGTAAFTATKHELRDARALRRDALRHALATLHRRLREPGRRATY